jgi:tetratricopeptide (TPR) repeat protein
VSVAAADAPTAGRVPFVEVARRPLAAGAALCLLVALAAALQWAREARFPRADIRERFLYIPSPAALDRLALDFDALVADIYWIRALQHYGGDRLSVRGDGRYELLYPLLDITTTLDPRFRIAYRFGAIFLAEPFPGGPGRPDQAEALLRKGLRFDPTRWEYLQDIGFIYYWQLGDFATAAAWFRRAAAVPGAPSWLEPLAATTLAAGGDRVSSRFLWRQIYETAQDDWMRREALRRLVQLDAMDEIDRLEARIRPFAAREPWGPLTWQRLVAAGVLPGVPLDPTGVPYELNPWWGAVTVAQRSRLFPLPTAAAAMARVVPAS